MWPRFIKVSRRLEQLNLESMYIYFPSDKMWTWEQTREPDTNGWETNNLDSRSYLNRELTRQERHQANERSKRREPGKERENCPQIENDNHKCRNQHSHNKRTQQEKILTQTSSQRMARLTRQTKKNG